MGTKLSKMTLSSIFKKPETVQYPAQTRPVPEGLKGHIENNIQDCIFCGICEKRCPAGALSVNKDEKTWSINVFRCVQCGSCVRECPKKCLRMEPTYASIAVEKTIRTIELPEESEEEKAKKAAKEAEKAAKIKAALEAKAARENKES